jgi:hypothetical protein
VKDVWIDSRRFGVIMFGGAYFETSGTSMPGAGMEEKETSETSRPGAGASPSDMLGNKTSGTSTPAIGISEVGMERETSRTHQVLVHKNCQGQLERAKHKTRLRRKSMRRPIRKLRTMIVKRCEVEGVNRLA